MPNDFRVTNFPVRHLEFLFSPPGLLLPERKPGIEPSTSVLVRGAAGTGKTTFALAVATGIAQVFAGKVVYLSTEISPVDVRFKVEDLGVDLVRLAAMPSTDPNAFLLIDHLALDEATPTLDGSESRTVSALARVERWLADGALSGVSVIVIDAFTLVGERSDRDLRARTIDLVESLAAEGVSLILVEEAPIDGADWGSFVVDVAFELSWERDPDTSTMLRRLGVPKSRFTRSHPGPWDYGLEGRTLAVWPALSADAVRGIRGRAEVVVAPHSPNQMLYVRGIAVSDTDPYFSRRMMKCPWLKPIMMPFRTDEDDVLLGPESMLWRVLREAASGKRMFLVSQLAPLLRRPRFANRLPDALSSLAAAGVLIILHDRLDELGNSSLRYTYAEGLPGVGFGSFTPNATPYPIRRGISERARRSDGGAEPIAESAIAKIDRLVLGGSDGDALNEVWGMLLDPAGGAAVEDRWAALNAVYAASDTAADWLLERAPWSPAVALLLVRALARRFYTSAMDRALDSLTESLGLPAWQRSRLRAEALMEADRKMGRRLLAAHVADETAPAQSRAEALMNLAASAPPRAQAALHAQARALIPGFPERPSA